MARSIVLHENEVHRLWGGHSFVAAAAFQAARPNWRSDGKRVPHKKRAGLTQRSRRCARPSFARIDRPGGLSHGECWLPPLKTARSDLPDRAVAFAATSASWL